MKSEVLRARDVDTLRRAIAPKLPRKTDRPAVIILVGLPGSGKSYFAAKLLERIPAAVLESDYLRKTLVRRPVYSQWEHIRLFRAIHALVKELLTAKYNVVLDATNLTENYRHPLEAIAIDTKAKSIIVHIDTPRDVAEKRLVERLTQQGGYSDADWAVYQKLEETFEPIKRPHFYVRTPMDILPVIDKIVSEIKIQG
ncbi:ATP-binding protein [Dehalogenimonas sp. THU2]|uniref:AAA family ATPase n=1 Tax=Dehalogenimonas sp. THU2 TaxID=3151121 RepID=UPI0032189194